MKILIMARFAAVAVILSACGMNKKAFHKSENVAIISLNSSSEVKNNNSIQARLITEARFDSSIVVDPAGKVQERLYKLHPLLTSKIVLEDSIISSMSFQRYADENAYNLKNLDAITTLGGSHVAVEGYPVIKAFSKKTIMKSFDHLPRSVDAVIVLSNNFALAENTSSVSFGANTFSSAGLGSQRVESTLSVYIVNRQGKKILNKTYIGRSEDKLDPDLKGKDLDRIANQSLDESFTKLNAYLIKKLKP